MLAYVDEWLLKVLTLSDGLVPSEHFGLHIHHTCLKDYTKKKKKNNIEREMA